MFITDGVEIRSKDNKGKRSVFFFLFIKESLRNKDNDIIKFYVPNGITMKYIKQE